LKLSKTLPLTNIDYYQFKSQGKLPDDNYTIIREKYFIYFENNTRDL